MSETRGSLPEHSWTAVTDTQTVHTDLRCYRELRMPRVEARVTGERE